MAPRIANNVIRATDPVKDDWDQWYRELSALAARYMTASDALAVTVAVAKRYPQVAKRVALELLGGSDD